MISPAEMFVLARNAEIVIAARRISIRQVHLTEALQYRPKLELI